MYYVGLAFATLVLIGLILFGQQLPFLSDANNNTGMGPSIKAQSPTQGTDKQ